jgi:hypothetical protein
MTTLWLFHDRLSLGWQHCSMWRRGGLCFHENGGRKSGECLDMTFVVRKFSFGVTIWGLGKLSWITRWLPAPKRSGYTVGWLPIGARDQ